MPSSTLPSAGSTEQPGITADPAAIAGTSADFRASLGIDLALDDQTYAAGQKIDCPVLLLWGLQATSAPGDEPLSIWQQYAPDIRGRGSPPATSSPKKNQT